MLGWCHPALTVRNSPPLLNKVLFAPARATTEDALRCQVVGASDPDGDQVRIRWNWYEGEAPLAVEGPVLAAEYTKRDHTYQCRATPSDGTLNGEAMTAEGEVQNAAPQIVKASILPRLPTTVDGLTCEANGVSDADGDPLTMTYRWTVNGVDSDIKASALPATVTRAGDTVICAIQADDGSLQSNSTAASAIRVQNTPPSVESAHISPLNVTRATSPKCEPKTVVDLDEDAVSFRTVWRVNGRVLGRTNQLPARLVRKGDELECAITPFDGSVEGAAVSASRVVGNTTPTIQSVRISPEVPRHGVALRCETEGVFDLDEDRLSTIFRWWRGEEQLAATGEYLAAEFVTKNQEYMCAASVSDGSVQAEYVRSKVVRSVNSPPLVEAVAVVPQTPTTTDPLSCETNDVRDADADPVMLTYAWFADGRDLNINAAILPAGSLVRGQKATCRVTPNDGEEDGMFKASSAVTLRNTPPSIKSVSVVPASAHTDEALACVPEEATDADDDPVSFRYSWSINGEAVGVRGARLAPNLTRRGDVLAAPCAASMVLYSVTR